MDMRHPKAKVKVLLWSYDKVKALVPAASRGHATPLEQSRDDRG
jgi:hypothetical protein